MCSKYPSKHQNVSEIGFFDYYGRSVALKQSLPHTESHTELGELLAGLYELWPPYGVHPGEFALTEAGLVLIFNQWDLCVESADSPLLERKSSSRQGARNATHWWNYKQIHGTLCRNGGLASCQISTFHHAAFQHEGTKVPSYILCYMSTLHRLLCDTSRFLHSTRWT